MTLEIKLSRVSHKGPVVKAKQTVPERPAFSGRFDGSRSALSAQGLTRKCAAITTKTPHELQDASNNGNQRVCQLAHQRPLHGFLFHHDFVMTSPSTAAGTAGTARFDTGAIV